MLNCVCIDLLHKREICTLYSGMSMKVYKGMFYLSIKPFRSNIDTTERFLLHTHSKITDIIPEQKSHFNHKYAFKIITTQ